MNSKILLRYTTAKANCENELFLAKLALEEGNHGKVRTCVRRAIGFLTEIYLLENPNSQYGHSFMNNLRGIIGDLSIPENIRNSAEILITKTSNYEVDGKTALENGEIVIEYFKKILEK